MAERPTVLLVGKGPPEVGGIPAFLEALRSSSLAERFDLRFLNLARGGARAGGRASLANLARSATDAAAVFRAARDADLVHVHSALAPGVTLLRAGLLVSAGRAAGAKVVLHAHGGRIQLWLEGERRLRLARAALRPAHAVVAVSRGAQNALAPARPDVVLVRNGVDLTRFRPRGEGSPPEPGGPPTVLFVGGLTPRKGVLDLFAASDALLARGIDHRLVLAGGIPDEGPEAERAVRDAVPAQARLLGPVAPDHVAELLQSADVFCLPSWWEAMPLAAARCRPSPAAPPTERSTPSTTR